MTATNAPTLIPGFRGTVLTPESAEYETARRVWNAAIDRRPALIGRCTGAADVLAALRHAERHRLPVAVRGGGHSIPGFSVCDDGLVVDLSGLRAIDVDPAARTARVGPGATWADLDAACQRFGLATPGGEVSDTGVAGLTLGGGIGWLSRLHGLSCDNLVSAEVVTAGGQKLTADDEHHADLFWGLRGGGGNFGIVTEFRFQLHPVTDVVGGPLMYPAEQAPEVLRAVQERLRSIPDELAVNIVLATLPPTLDVPDALRGRAGLIVIPAWFGDGPHGPILLEELRGIGQPAVDGIGPIPYPELQRSMDPMTPPGRPSYIRADMLGPLDGTAIDMLVEHASRAPSPFSAVMLRLAGGAMARVDPAATAFPNRRAEWVMTIAAIWASTTEDAAPHTQWARETWAAMHPYARGTYVNYLAGDEGAERLEQAYGGPGPLGRLAQVKAAYDPDNVFRLNQNIRPAEPRP
jgi:FAD/FMN-containing dehydrogenase